MYFNNACGACGNNDGACNDDNDDKAPGALVAIPNGYGCAAKADVVADEVRPADAVAVVAIVLLPGRWPALQKAQLIIPAF